MSYDHYPDHVKSVEELISSGEAQKKVAREIAEDRKVPYRHTYLYQGGREGGMGGGREEEGERD